MSFGVGDCGVEERPEGRSDPIKIRDTILRVNRIGSRERKNGLFLPSCPVTRPRDPMRSGRLLVATVGVRLAGISPWRRALLETRPQRDGAEDGKGKLSAWGACAQGNPSPRALGQGEACPDGVDWEEGHACWQSLGSGNAGGIPCRGEGGGWVRPRGRDPPGVSNGSGETRGSVLGACSRGCRRCVLTGEDPGLARRARRPVFSAGLRLGFPATQVFPLGGCQRPDRVVGVEGGACGGRFPCGGRARRRQPTRGQTDPRAAATGSLRRRYCPRTTLLRHPRVECRVCFGSARGGVERVSHFHDLCPTGHLPPSAQPPDGNERRKRPKPLVGEERIGGTPAVGEKGEARGVTALLSPFVSGKKL